MKHLFVLLCVKLKHLFRCPVTIGNKTGNGFINLLMLKHKNLTLKSPKIHVSTSDHKWLQLSLKEWFKNRSRTKTKNKATSCIIPINHWKMPTIFSDSSLWICCWYIIHRMSRFSSQSHWASSTISSIMKTHVFSDFMCRCVCVYSIDTWAHSLQTEQELSLSLSFIRITPQKLKLKLTQHKTGHGGAGVAVCGCTVIIA